MILDFKFRLLLLIFFITVNIQSNCASVLYNHNHCRPGFRGKDCDVNIDDCVQNLCQNNGSCIDGINSYTCDCSPQFSGQFCHQDVDECISRPNICKNGATCINIYGSFKCICTNGWTGPDCSINEDDCVSHQCENGATCEDKIGSYECKCSPGYAGIHCQFKDRCFVNPCQSGAVCNTLPIDGTYSCSCKPGFTGVNCTEDLNECNHSDTICAHGGKCVNTPGSYYCECPKGFTGSQCEHNIDECSDGSPCKNGASCVDYPNQYRCVCMPGYTGTHCEDKLDESIGDYRKEDQHYYSDAKSIDTSCGINPCLNNGTCRKNGASYHCNCLPGFFGKLCQHDYCWNSPCSHGGQCISLEKSFVCNCRPGFTGITCERDIDECQASINPCRNNATCKNFAGSYQCLCLPGFTGIDCSISHNECARKPCFNGGTCVHQNGNYDCNCTDMYGGKNCEINLRELIPSTPDPWRFCHLSQHCASRFLDGFCNQECNIVTCFFDGYECDQSRNKSAAHDKCDGARGHYCLANYGNGLCDKDCDSEACGWDGGDCYNTTTTQSAKTSEDLIIWVAIPPQDYSLVTRLLMEISEKTRTTVRVKYDENNNRMIEPIHGTNLTKLSLVADPRNCEEDCLTKTIGVADFLSAARNNGNNPGSLLNIVQGVKSGSKIRNVKDLDGRTVVVLVGIFTTLITAIAMVSIKTSNGTKRIRAPCWYPVGSRPAHQTRTNLTQNRSMHNISTYQAASGDYGQRPQKTLSLKSCRNLYGRLPKVDSQEMENFNELAMKTSPSLVKTKDGQTEIIYNETTDYRNWSTMHLKAYGETKTIINQDTSTLVKNGLCTPPSDEKRLRGPNNFMDISGPGNLTPLMAACASQKNVPDCHYQEPKIFDDLSEDLKPMEENVVQQILDNGADITKKSDFTDETCLHIAARNGRTEFCKLLLAKGADSNARDRTGRTPLHTAIAANMEGVFQQLIIHRATDLNARTYDGTTPLILAARYGSYSMLQHLIMAKAEVSASDNKGRTALHWAALVNSERAVELLILHGANIDAQDDEDATSLFLAAREGSKDVVKKLLDKNANKDLVDNMGRSPKDVAENRMHHDIVALLLTHESCCSSHKKPKLQHSQPKNASLKGYKSPNSVVSSIKSPDYYTDHWSYYSPSSNASVQSPPQLSHPQDIYSQPHSQHISTRVFKSEAESNLNIDNYYQIPLQTITQEISQWTTDNNYVNWTTQPNVYQSISEVYPTTGQYDLNTTVCSPDTVYQQI